VAHRAFRYLEPGNPMTRAVKDTAATAADETAVREDDADGGRNQEVLREIAKMLVRLAEQMGDGEDPVKEAEPGRQHVLAIAETVVAFRQRRQDFFAADLFGEPAWDILLDLFVAALKGEERLVKQLCIAAQLPSTTALRYISRLEDGGIVRRIADKVDRRRIYIALTRKGFEAMQELIAGSRVSQSS
jgi:DNA-binding MarR family transcriptional regulator